jgi:hypothetical protein
MSYAPSAAEAEASNSSSTIRFGGMLGIAACAIGIAIFLVGCLGYDAAFTLAIIPLAMSAVGLLISIVGGILRHGGVEHTGAPAAVFINIFGLVGGLLEFALYMNWTIFPHAAG